MKFQVGTIVPTHMLFWSQLQTIMSV